MQEPDMPDLVKSFFETHKASIHLFLVIMNVLSYQGSGCKYMFCCAVIWQKPIWDLWRCTCTYTSSCNLSLHFILFSASLTAWQNFNPVHSAMLFSQRFFCRFSFSLLALFLVKSSWQALMILIHAQTTLTCVSLPWLRYHYRAQWLA